MHSFSPSLCTPYRRRRVHYVTVLLVAAVCSSACAGVIELKTAASPSSTTSAAPTSATPAPPAPDTTDLLQAVINRVSSLTSAQRRAVHPVDDTEDISDEYGQLDGKNCYARMVKEGEMMMEIYVSDGHSYSYQSPRLADTSLPKEPNAKVMYTKAALSGPSPMCLTAQDLDELTTLAATQSQWDQTGQSITTTYQGKQVYQVTNAQGIEMYVDTQRPIRFVITVDPKAQVTTEYAQFDAVPTVQPPPADTITQ